MVIVRHCKMHFNFWTEGKLGKNFKMLCWWQVIRQVRAGVWRIDGGMSRYIKQEKNQSKLKPEKNWAREKID